MSPLPDAPVLRAHILPKDCLRAKRRELRVQMSFVYDGKSLCTAQDAHLAPNLFHKLSYMSRMILTPGMQLIGCTNSSLTVICMDYGNSRKTTCTSLGEGETLNDFNNVLPFKTVDSEARMMP